MTDGVPLAARAAARVSAYRLLARLFRQPVTGDLRATLGDLPGLGDELPQRFDADEAAAEHHRLFALQVPPFAGVFRDPEGRIGGEWAARVRDVYARAGLELDERSEEGDHVAHALDLLAEIGGRRALAQDALDGVLLPWLPWLVEAVGRHGAPFHRACAELTLELAIDHRAELGGAPPDAPIPPVEDPLDDPRAGLGSVARYLVTPARSGLYLARDDVRGLAVGGALPTGFGGRADSLETVLRAAAELDALDPVLDGLRALVDGGRAACAALDGAAGGALAGTITLRRARLDRTDAVLARLHDASRAQA